MDASDQLRDLIDFHVDFAVSSADVIRVHDRDLARLDDDDRHRVRRLHASTWMSGRACSRACIRPAPPGRPARCGRTRASDSHQLDAGSVRALRDAPSEADVHDILADLAFAALSAD